MAAGDEIVGISAQFISELGKIGLWLQTIGVIVILWLFFEFVAFFINRKRMKEIYKIKEDMNRIEGKIDKLISIKSK